jgi:hypothetical protein
MKLEFARAGFAQETPAVTKIRRLYNDIKDLLRDADLHDTTYKEVLETKLIAVHKELVRIQMAEVFGEAAPVNNDD